jgi:O-Antigen ligase
MALFARQNRGVQISARLMEAGTIWLVVSLLFARGTFREALYLIAIGFVLHMGCASTPLLRSDSLRWALRFLGVLWVWGLVVNAGSFWAFGNATLWAALMITVIDQLSPTFFNRWRWESLLGPLMVSFVGAHVIWNLWVRPVPSAINDVYPGIYSNIHHISEYVILIAPFLAFFFLTQQGWRKWMYALALVGELSLLVSANSRPGYLAMISSILVAVPLVSFTTRWRLISGMLLVVALLYFGDIGHFATRMNDLAANSDERMVIWKEWKNLFLDGDCMARWFGHGLGQFTQDFHEAAVRNGFPDFQSPHNVIFEILYSHGILGLLWVLTGLFFFAGALVLTLLKETHVTRRMEGLTLVSAMIGLAAHVYFTMPFFSRDFMLPFGLLSGLGLLYLGRKKTESPSHD